VLEESPDNDMYFIDESRFGTHSKIGHGWFRKGLRISIKVKQEFENFYVYSAVNPSTGKDFSLLLPKVNTICMNIYLAEMSKILCSKSVILVMDCAGWHKSKGQKVLDNIQIVHLPPYSPELNPVERLWGHMKSNTIINKVYNTIDDLEEVVVSFIRNFRAEV
jgi:hypothetical protein